MAEHCLDSHLPGPILPVLHRCVSLGRSSHERGFQLYCVSVALDLGEKLQIHKVFDGEFPNPTSFFSHDSVREFTVREHGLQVGGESCRGAEGKGKG